MRIPARWQWLTPLIPELGRQRHAALCEFEVSVVYIMSPRPAQGDTQRNTVSEKKKGGGGSPGGVISSSGIIPKLLWTPSWDP